MKFLVHQPFGTDCYMNASTFTATTLKKTHHI